MNRRPRSLHLSLESLRLLSGEQSRWEAEIPLLTRSQRNQAKAELDALIGKAARLRVALAAHSNEMENARVGQEQV